MIYTIGYQNLTPSRLQEIVTGLDAVLFDVRHVPRSRKAGFGGNQLQALLGERYVAQGEQLGGRGHVTKSGLCDVVQYQADFPGTGRARYGSPKHVILMCLEEAPGDCHRHSDICSAHFPDAIHIYQDELFTARALDTALQAGDDVEYDLCGSLDDLIR